MEAQGRGAGRRRGGVVSRVPGHHGPPAERSQRTTVTRSNGMTPWASPAVVRYGVFIAAAAVLWPACTCRGEKRELGLSRARDAAPVIIVDQPVEGGVVGPLGKEVE